MNKKPLCRKKLFTAAIVISSLSFSISVCFAADITSAGSGSWNTPSIWTGNVIPQSGDNVFIRPGDNITVTATTTVNSITFLNTNNTKSILTVNTGAVLSVAGGILLQNAADKNTNATIQGAGKISCEYFTIGSTEKNPSTNCTASLTSTISELNVAQDLLIRAEVNGNMSGHSFFYLNSGSLMVRGSVILDADGEAAKPTSSIDLTSGSGSGKLYIEGATPFYKLGTGTNYIKLNGIASTVIYSGNCNQPILNTRYNNLSVSGGGVKSVEGEFIVDGILTIEEGVTLNQASAIITIPYTGSLIVNGTLDFSSAAGAMKPSGGMTKLIMGSKGYIKTMSYAGLLRSDASLTQVSQNVSWDMSSISSKGTVEYYLNSSGAGGNITIQTVTNMDYNNLVFSGSIEKLWMLGGNHIVNGDFTIMNGTPLRLAANHVLTVKGDWINNSSLVDPGFTNIALGGDKLQKVSGASESIFFNLIINNEQGVLLEQNANVSNVLTMSKGLLKIPVSKTLTLTNSNAQTIGGFPFNETKHIVTQVNESGGMGGLLIKNIPANSSYLFPVGNGSYYLPVTLKTSGKNDYAVAAFTGFTVNGVPGIPLGEAQRKNVVNVVWDVEGTQAISTEMSLSWPMGHNLEGSNVLKAIDNRSGLGITQFKNDIWNIPSGTYDFTSNTVTSNVSSFSPFSVGIVDEQVLSVRFSDIRASEKSKGVEVGFTNLTESEIEYYEIERSLGGHAFLAVKRVTPLKNDNGKASYTWIDENALEGRIVYRIKAVETTGKVVYSDTVCIKMEAKNSGLYVFFQNGQLVIRISNLPEGKYMFRIVNASGQQIHVENIHHSGGSLNHSISLNNASRGVYILDVHGPVQMQKKFLLK